MITSYTDIPEQHRWIFRAFSVLFNLTTDECIKELQISDEHMQHFNDCQWFFEYLEKDGKHLIRSAPTVTETKCVGERVRELGDYLSEGE